MGYFSQSRIIWVFLLLGFSVFLYASLATAQILPKEEDSNLEYREVAVGSIELLELDFVAKRVEIVKKGVFRKAENLSDGSTIKLTPIKNGETDVIIYDTANRIRRRIRYTVTKTDLSLQVTQMRRLLDTVEGLQIASVGDKVVIDGELVVPKDLDRVLRVVDAFGGCKGKNICLMQLSKVSQRAIARRIQDEINSQPGSVNVTVKVANDTFFLNGVVDSIGDRQRAEDIAKTYVPEVLVSQSVAQGVLKEIKKQAIRNLIDVNEPPPNPPPKTVRVTFHFVEIGKEYFSAAFLKWAPNFNEAAGIEFGRSTTGDAAASANGSFVGSLTNLFPRIQKGTNGGFARVLFSAVGIGRADTQINISRTDQVPFIDTINGVPVSTNRSVSISMAVTPRIEDNDTIFLERIDFSFDALLGNGAGGNPGVRNTRVINNVAVKSGESAVLGGLIANNMALDVDRDPDGAPADGAGNPLFTLLRSKSFRRNKSQFVVFVTPQIIPDASKGTEDIKKKIIGNRKKRKRIYR